MAGCSGAFWGSCGQDVVEYGIIIASIAVVILLGMTTFGNQITPLPRSCVALPEDNVALRILPCPDCAG